MSQNKNTKHIIFEEDSNEYFNDMARSLKILVSEKTLETRMFFRPYLYQFQIEQDGNNDYIDLRKSEIVILLKKLHDLLGKDSPFVMIEKDEVIANREIIDDCREMLFYRLCVFYKEYAPDNEHVDAEIEAMNDLKAQIKELDKTLGKEELDIVKAVRAYNDRQK